MDVCKPLRVILFSYELFRLLVLAVLFAFFPPSENVVTGGVFPYLVYVTPNALFPLMTFFMCLRPSEYRNYLPLYMAGKAVAAAAFYVWGVFILQAPLILEYLRTANVAETLALFGGSFVLNVCDILSIFGIWILIKKTNSMEESAGSLTGDNGGL
jgi:hypothetical protein